MKTSKLLMIVIFSILILSGCGEQKQKVSLEDTLSPSQNPKSDVQEMDQTPDASIVEPKTATVQKAEKQKSYQGVGSFIARDVVVVSAKQKGNIVYLPKDVGDAVKRGTIICRVDKSDYEMRLKNAAAQLGVAEATMKNAENEFNRKKKLFDSGAISSGLFEQYSSGLELAQAHRKSALVAVAVAEKALRETVTFAGVSGVITERLTHLGQFIAVGDPAVNISILNPVKLSFSVPQHLTANVVPGANVRATLSAYPGRFFNGKVTRIYPTLDAQSRTIPIEAEFENPDRIIKPGFFSECEVDLATSDNYFTIPVSALLESESGSFVEIANGEDNRKILVFVINHRGNVCTVSGDLSDGDTIILQQ